MSSSNSSENGDHPASGDAPSPSFPGDGPPSGTSPISGGTSVRKVAGAIGIIHLARSLSDDPMNLSDATLAEVADSDGLACYEQLVDVR